ncbi:DUF6904 family protein [Cohnella zeiphila]|uniref:Uncharacterized protein n=1 Tax=Cohnella zeiphila TaxID=2761120 RepID=A0A7X0SSW0_9BACL|nr:hypothetical protein [Cohnella zeiphila]MBB6734265.1 hypothetical protein [Cohnella zeiphila]
MIRMKDTLNHAGVNISGDAADLEQLCEALEQIVGEEGEAPAYESIRVRVADLVRRLRGSLQAAGEMAVNVCWPEALFLSVALNRFIKLYYAKEKRPDWERMLARVRKFQEELVACLRRTLPDAAYKPASVALGSSVFLEQEYMTHYLDELNVRFLELKPEKRLENIPVMAKRIVEQGEEYRKCKHAVLEAARMYKCPVDEIRIGAEMPAPEQIIW